MADTPKPPLDITKMTVEQLQALGYNQVKLRDNAVNNLHFIEQELAKREASKSE